MEKIYSRPVSLNPVAFNYCPGCLHGTSQKLLCDVIDELGKQEDTIAVMPIGCSTMGMFAFDFESLGACHGRAPAVATGVKRTAPEKLVFTYQGDGDIGYIGFSEIMHAANRGENFTVIFANNGTFGMTGGQMAPTTLIGQRATTAPLGRDPSYGQGMPIHMSELVASLPLPVYVERCSVDTPAHANATRKAIKKAFDIQLAGKGFSFVEILTNCPTNWGVSPVQSIAWIKEKTYTEYPLGVYKDITQEG
ncbi:MAG: 2-oxoglutarate oxidoreductase [Clostridiales Family XIII bacterium]|jgi:2-oxoglutarate ferredoxin oxidoreductase subunit beta|nr:2-oxoglutarate oxidoreductase [Clostridiales Family XIII bacterium]